jgi:integrase
MLPTGGTVVSKVNLTEKFIVSAKRIPPSGRVEYHDALVPGLALRVSSFGHRAYVLIARFPAHPRNPTRRALGQHGELTLDQAREKARAWLALLRKGVDPKVQEARERAAAQRSQANSFRVVAADFLQYHAAKLVKAKEIRRIIETEFVRRWGARPAIDIMPDEVAAVIRQIAKQTPAMAHISLGYLSRMYSWAIGQHTYGITSSPTERLRPTELIGKLVARERVLTDDELRRVWEAAGLQAYPFGSIVQMLILSAQRLNEVAQLSWSEIDLDKRLATIASTRMKGSRPHEIPLAPKALALLQDLPRFPRGDYVFTTTSGQKPFAGFAKAKRRLDEWSGVTGWVLHDLRRTARTHFSALPVQDLVCELVIAHARPGLHQVYDLHRYRDEKLECLRLWEARLCHIVAPPPPADVVALRPRAKLPPPRRPRPPAATAVSAAPVATKPSMPSIVRRPLPAP